MPAAREAGGTRGDGDLAPAPGMLFPSATPTKGQTLNGDKALGQVLQAGLTGSAPAIKNRRANKGGRALLPPFLLCSWDPTDACSRFLS